MNRLAFAVLLAALPACRKPGPPVPPTPAAIGAELATYPQLLAPLTHESMESLVEAVNSHGAGSVTAANFRQSYLHRTAIINGVKTAVFVGYSTPWQALEKTPLQPMSVLQFLHAFAVDAETEIVMLHTPKGTLYFTREQLVDVIGAARTAGATSGDQPFTFVLGSAK